MSEEHGCCRPSRRGGPGEALYGLGIFGAAVHFIQVADGFWAGALGLLKAVFWPAFAVHKIFQLWGL